jgi:hypothetical protein
LEDSELHETPSNSDNSIYNNNFINESNNNSSKHLKNNNSSHNSNHFNTNSNINNKNNKKKISNDSCNSKNDINLKLPSPPQLPESTTVYPTRMGWNGNRHYL